MIDVAVVGSGPGGTAAAIWAASKGLRVVLIEASGFPRYRPGETLHPGVEPILSQLGVRDGVNAAGFVRHPGIYLAWNHPVRFSPYGSDGETPWLGYQAWRPAFDEILLRRAKASGVEVLQPCIAKQPIVECDNAVRGVITSLGRISARFVIDATGSVSWLSKRLALERLRHSRCLTARYGYLTGNGHCPETPKLESTANGWRWIAEVQANVYQWTSVSVDHSRGVQSDFPEELAGSEPVGNVRTADVTWTETITPAGPGYFLVGDAAAVLDPLSSHGVLKALMSGIQAADLIDQTRAGLTCETAAEVYCSWMQKWLRYDMEHLAVQYAKAGIDVLAGLPECD